MTDLVHSPAEPSAQPLEACASCGAPLAEDQRWCLNCGTRRASVETPFGARASTPPPPKTTLPPVAAVAAVAPAADGPPRWLQAVLGAALAAVLFAIGLVVGLSGGDRRTIVSVPPGEPPVVNVDVQGGGAAAPVAAADPTAGGIASDWPEATDGWTVQLKALPGDTDQAAADAAKSDAESQGASDVGVLLSDDYASLPPDKVIVYSGVFNSKSSANEALGPIKKDFPKAEVVQVSATGSSDGPAEKVADETLDALQSDDPEEQQEASKKLPEEVSSGEGTPPPVDDKAPGGGSGGGVTIG